MLAAVRTTIFAFFSLCLTIVYGLLSLTLGVFSQTTRHKITISWCHCIIFLARTICGIRYKISGRENIAKITGPFVVMAKHQSMWETFFLQILFFPASTILKKQLLEIPFFGWGLRGLRPIAIDRDNPREALRQVKKSGVEAIEDNLNIVLFPEGTRIKPGEKGKYARSGAEIAINAQVPIIPVALNAGLFWRNEKFTKSPGTIDVIIGEPIAHHDKTSRELTLEVESWIEEKMQSIPPLSLTNTHSNSIITH